MITKIKNAELEEITGGLKQPAGIQALQMIIQKLNHGEFVSGQSIKESVLAKEFELSRNAIREALNQIVGWGIFEYIPYCGYRVRNFTAQDMLEWVEMREAIEPIAARRLARVRPPKVLAEMELALSRQAEAVKINSIAKLRNADIDFHLAVVRHCGNRRFEQLQSVSYLSAAFLFNTANRLPSRYQVSTDTIQHLPSNYTREEFENKANELTLECHRRMWEAIRSGNAAEAENLFREHAHIQVENMENTIMYYGHMKLEELLSGQKIVLS